MPEAAAAGVLIIDDQAEFRALMQMVLRRHGFEVYLAENGRDGLSFFRVTGETINIVVIGSLRRDLDGLKTLAELQKVKADVRVCFVAGPHQHLADHELMAMGAARVIRQPFEPSDLARVLRDLTEIRDRRRGPRRTRLMTRAKVGPGIEPLGVVDGWILEKGYGGLSLRIPQKLGEVGAILSVRSADADEETPWTLVQIRHIRSENGMWIAGCELLHLASRKFI